MVPAGTPVLPTKTCPFFGTEPVEEFALRTTPESRATGLSAMPGGLTSVRFRPRLLAILRRSPGPRYCSDLGLSLYACHPRPVNGYNEPDKKRGRRELIEVLLWMEQGRGAIRLLSWPTLWPQARLQTHPPPHVPPRHHRHTNADPGYTRTTFLLSHSRTGSAASGVKGGQQFSQKSGQIGLLISAYLCDIEGITSRFLSC
jgi:hypothetical protein